MPHDRDTKLAAAHPAHEDHARLHVMLDHLDDERDVHEVRRRLAELRDFLVRHFAEETGTGGLFEDLLRRRPSNQRILRTLEAEHGAALTEVVRLVRLAEQLQEGLTQLTASLRRHEEQEWELTRDAYLDDIGVGG